MLAYTVTALVVALYIFWKYIFLRNPSRTIPKGKNLVSPADGKVVAVAPFSNNEVTIFKGNRRQLGTIRSTTNDVSKNGTIISIFMSPFNVHYNRSPMSGTIESVTHLAGKFLPVNSLEHGLENEKTEILIKNGATTIKVLQIAGFLARRIETYVQPYDTIKKGSVIGVINLGSQVTVILPSSVMPTIKVGQKVKAGETIIAKINS